MNVRELNRWQLDELKQAYVCETMEIINWGDMTDATDIITDETIYNHYDGIDFVNDDFLCSCG